MKVITLTFDDVGVRGTSYTLIVNDDQVEEVTNKIDEADKAGLYTIMVREPEELDYVLQELREQNEGED